MDRNPFANGSKTATGSGIERFVVPALAAQISVCGLSARQHDGKIHRLKSVLPRRALHGRPMEEKYFGHSVVRKEGREKVTGRARYVDDLSVPDMLHGVTVRSNIARGRIRGIRFGDGIPWNEFTIVTAADIPGKNEIALIEHDQPCLAAETINHPEEAIILLAHADRYLLEEARRAVQIDVEPLPAIFTIEDSLAKRAIISATTNFQVLSHGKGRCGCGVGAGGDYRRRRIPDRRAGAAIHREPTA